MKKKTLIPVFTLLLLLCGLIYLFTPVNQKTRERLPEKESITEDSETPSIHTVSGYGSSLQILDPEKLSSIVHKILNNETTDEEIELPNTPQVVTVVLRKNGLRLAEAWGKSSSTVNALKKAVGQAKKKLPAKAWSTVTVAEVCFLHSFEELRYGDKKERRQLLGNIHRGIRGIEISYNDSVELYSPTHMIATNRSPKRIIELYKREHSLTEEQLEKEVRFRRFQGYQLLAELGQFPRTTFMERGNQFVPIEEVTRTNVADRSELAAEWLVNNLHEDGRMTYKYWPSRNAESAANNMIRQWMATVALGRVAAEKNSEKLWKLVEQNIDYNLSHYFSYQGDLGYIKWNEKVKLGSLALAALAILEHPKRDKWAAQEQALQRGIEGLWLESGAFITFYEPWGRNDNQNFYPGEALLYWAELYSKTDDQELLSRIMQSFRYYKNWHQQEENRNPAFIPWHTQAYYLVWKKTRNEELKQFIFEMNDWLLHMQQWSGLRYADTKGRFYNPRKPYGPPHSSSTGVYLEGLIDAYKLAEETGDNVRKSSYRKVTLRGLRSVMQLQFVDDVDMFYIPEKMKKRVKGGIRTTVYDNRIRCDNVQHNLMALLKILDHFDEKDFVP